MTSLFFGNLTSTGVPADEKVVRSTATPVDDDAPAAMQTDMPEMNEVETDSNPDLGMVNRSLASKWIDRERSVPPWLNDVNTQTEHNLIVDRQVSTSGYSAGQEATGNWGHGTMPAAIGIEPVGDLRDGGKMGNDYFTTNRRAIQELADPTMMSPTNNYDRNTIGRVMADGKSSARQAALAAAYDTFWNGGH